MEKMEHIMYDYGKRESDDLIALDKELSTQTDGYSGRLCENALTRTEAIKRVLIERGYYYDVSIQSYVKSARHGG